MSGIISFLLLHAIQPNRQERFAFPIVPALLLAVVLALWDQKERFRHFLRPRWLFATIVAISLILNFTLLVFLTSSSAKIGAVEPLARLQAEEADCTVLLVRPKLPRWLPREYGGESMTRNYVTNWSRLPELAAETTALEHLDFVVLYPQRPADLNAYIDSVSKYCGTLAPHFEVGPSRYDRLLHWINPDHNPDYHAWVMRVVP